MVDGKRAGWIFTFVIALLLFFSTPVVTEKSWLQIIEGWLNDYHHAAESVSGEDEDDDEVEQGHPVMTVTLDESALDYAGIETMPIRENLLFPELKAYALVMDLRALVEWRSRINQAEAATTIARVSEASTRQELNRLKKLAQGTGSVASKQVNYADARWQEARASLQAAQLSLEDSKTELSQAWGETIAAWVLNRDSEQFERLVHHEEALLLLTLPVNESLPTDVNAIRVSRDGEKATAHEAYFVSPAYVSAEQVQGETYYLRIAANSLRQGMRLDAWIPQNDEPLRGFHIPEQAVVWYAGQPWAYVQQGEATYKRRPLASGENVVDGIFIQSGFKEGEALVIAGSQMLLSEEFRWQIHDEDDD